MALKSTKKWKDRGWWVSVEIDQKPAARKNENRVRELLDQAQERYNLYLECGKTLNRGIFTAKADMQSLSRLLDQCRNWKETKIYANGHWLESGRIGRLQAQLKCAGTRAPCRSGERHEQLAFLGCHLSRVGFMNYSLASLKKGDRYWFSYLKSEKGDYRHAYLDKSRLAKDLEPYQWCPRFPAITSKIVARLPSAVSLKPVNNQLFWMPTGRKIRSTWMCRFPPVVPCSADHYRHWLERLLASPT